MKRTDMRNELERGMRCVRVSPELARRTLHAAREKEKKYMKKKISAAAVFTLLAALLCAAAIAAANRWSMLDFVDRYSAEHYIPEDAQSYVQTDVAVMENEWVSVSVRELYYDGRISRMTVDVTPKEENTLLMGEDVLMEDPFVNLMNNYVVDGDNDMRSVWQVIQEEGVERVYSVGVFMKGAQDDMISGTGDYMLGEDGTLTLYSQEEYRTDMPKRDVSLSVIVMPFDQPLTIDSCGNYEKAETLDMPVTLEASVFRPDESAHGSGAANVYVSENGADYPQAGVHVDRVTLNVKPQEIYATIEYTVVNRDVFDALEGGLWFEFIDPQREGEPWQQRLAEGLSGGGSAGAMDGKHETAMRFCQRETLGRNELHESYTLRAYNAWEKSRYEAREIRMRPADESDIE